VRADIITVPTSNLNENTKVQAQGNGGGLRRPIDACFAGAVTASDAISWSRWSRPSPGPERDIEMRRIPFPAAPGWTALGDVRFAVDRANADRVAAKSVR
jgi:hypothetical protein